MAGLDLPLPPEPFRIKMVEPLRRTTREERERLLREAGYNLFALPSDSVYVDLLTDSGVGAMSDNQWAGLMLGDESYAGSRSFRSLQEAVRELLGFELVIPCHQGRGVENVLGSALLRPGMVVVGNLPFDTTRAHIEQKGCRVVDCTVAEAYEPAKEAPFKGNVDLAKLDQALREHRGKVGYCLVTATCNGAGGQPVSMANLEAVAGRCRGAKVPLILDIARYAENALFVQRREKGFEGKSLGEIARAMCSLADAVAMSGKKNALVNIGGFLATNSRELYERCAPFAVLYEGFLTYGGLAGRDLEAMARGLREGLEQGFLEHRVGQVHHLHRRLQELGIPLLNPPGGHAVYVDALEFLPQVPRAQFPGHTLAVELYLEAGVRGVEVGAVMAGRDPATRENRYPPMELLRLAVPARTYTRDHLDWVAAGLGRVWRRREGIRGFVFDREAPVLRHFTSTFRRAA